MNIFINNDTRSMHSIEFRVDGVLNAVDISAGTIRGFKAMGIAKNEIQAWADKKLKEYANQTIDRSEYLMNCLMADLEAKGL